MLMLCHQQSRHCFTSLLHLSASACSCTSKLTEVTCPLVTTEEVATLRVRAARDADGLVVDLQADGAGELALDALLRGRQRRRAGGRLRAELRARRDKVPKHRHHGAADSLQMSSRAEEGSDPSIQRARRQRVIAQVC